MRDCKNCNKIDLLSIAARLFTQMALIPSSDDMDQFERYEMVRDIIDGIICGISRMQDGTFVPYENYSWHTQSEEVQRAFCESCKERKKNGLP